MSKRPIYYDTETTGISPKKERIIEIAAYDPERNATFEELVNPKMPIPPEATAIHKISDEMVASSPEFSEIAEKFIKFCEGDVVLIAHNNDAFDLLFLQNEFARCNLTLPSWEYIDTLKWARRYRPDLPRHTLQSLREIYDFKANNAHRALDDVIILHKVFSVMIDDLTIDQIIELLKIKRDIKAMPFGKHQGKPLQEVPRDYIAWLASSGAFDKAENKQLQESFQNAGML